jgi:NAD(P)-dependent dehydrogenase (short-subunit alcohol dehydrogenase family)
MSSMPHAGTKLQEQVAIVTGGAKGVGAGIVAAFVAEGAAVVIADRDAEAAARLIEQLGNAVSFTSTDVSSGEAVQNLIDVTVERFGRLDIVVNNAGYHISKPVEHTTEEEWDYLIDTNLKSTFLCCKYAIPHLRQTKGRIINISSMVGLVGQRDAGAYAASKGGQIAMTKNMALDLAADGVRVNAICPGWVATPLVEDWFGQQPEPEAARQYIYGVHPLGRIAGIDELGRAAVFLASEDSSFVTGTALEVDGGVTLGY